MTHVKELSDSSRPRVSEPVMGFSRIKNPRFAIGVAIAGALCFWVPDVVVHILAKHNFDSRHVWAITILMPVAFLIAYLIARPFAAKRGFNWLGLSMLVGVWVTGGLFMMITAMASGDSIVGAHGIWRIVVVALSVIPIVTYILAAYDGSLFALLAVTLGGLVVWGVRASWTVLRSAPPVVAADKDPVPPRAKAA